MTGLAKSFVLGQETNAQAGQQAAPAEDRRFGSQAMVGLLPPYPPEYLCDLFEQSGALRSNVDVMVTNVEAFGHRLVPTIDLQSSGAAEQIRDSLLVEALWDSTPARMDDSEVARRHAELRALERLERLQTELFLEHCCSPLSLVEVRQRTRLELEQQGNAYWEILRNQVGEIAAIQHIPAVTMRLMRADDELVRVDERVRVSCAAIRTVQQYRRFRRYVQLVNGSPVGYFREFGDPRCLSSLTGRRYRDEAELHAVEGEHARPATEILHFAVYSPRSVYGVPRWVGAFAPVLGLRESEEVNLAYFNNKSVPPLAILVSGGLLAPGAVDRIERHIEHEIKGKRNYHKILVLEAEGQGGALAGAQAGRVRIVLQPLTDAQQQDALFQTYEQNCEERVGRCWRIPRILRGNVQDFNRSCYSADTETLTEHGWRLHRDISAGERIAAYDPATGEVVFVVPERKLVYDVVDEEMWRFQNRYIDCLVTGDHRMLVRSAQTRDPDPPWMVYQAAQIPFNRFETAQAAHRWVGDELQSFTLPEVVACVSARGHQHGVPVRGDDWLEFLGYWIAEGGLVTTDHPAAPYMVYLDQKKPAIRDKIRACLKRLGWRFSEQLKPCGTTHFLFSNKCLRDWLLRHCGVDSQTRRIPDEYRHLSRRQIGILFQALMLGDGTASAAPGHTNGSYYTTSPVLAGHVQELLLLLGRRSVVRWSSGATCYRVQFAGRRVTRLSAIGASRTPAAVSRVRYTGEVYCFAVPEYGFFVTRRNGKIAIQGNTAEAAVRYAEQQIFQPERSSMDHQINRILLDRGVRFYRFESNSPVEKDPPALVTMVKDLVETGILTPNEARGIASDALNTRYDRVNAPWGRIPLRAAQAGFSPEPTADELQAVREGARDTKPGMTLAPTDAATVVTVNEARASLGVGPLQAPDGQPDPDGRLSVTAYRAVQDARAKLPAAQPLAERAREIMQLRDELLSADDQALAEVSARRGEAAQETIQVPREEFEQWIVPDSSTP